jgi:hypothetical protein
MQILSSFVLSADVFLLGAYVILGLKDYYKDVSGVGKRSTTIMKMFLRNNWTVVLFLLVLFAFFFVMFLTSDWQICADSEPCTKFGIHSSCCISPP